MGATAAIDELTRIRPELEMAVVDVIAYGKTSMPHVALDITAWSPYTSTAYPKSAKEVGVAAK